MNTENMLKLAEYMDKVPERNFYMPCYLSIVEPDGNHVEMDRLIMWENAIGVNGIKLPKGRVDLTAPDCNTAACMAGHAVMLLGTDEQVQQYLRTPLDACEIATDLLGLRDSLFELYLFGAAAYETPQEGARRLRKLVANHAAR